MNGARLWVSTQGAGEPVVLCHGGPGLWDYLEPMALMIDDRVTVHRYDQRGCGRSATVPPYDVATMVGDLEALRRRWGYRDWIVAGHSWGADLALCYSLAYPARTRALIYVAGSSLDMDWRDEYRANQRSRLTPAQQLEMGKLRSRLVRVRGVDFEEADSAYCRLLWSTDIADRDRAKELADRLISPGRHPNYRVNQDLLEDWRRLVSEGELKQRARKLEMPILIVHGEEDPRPSSIARRLVQQIPKAQLVIMPNVGHFPFLEAPDSFGSTILSFLSGLSGAPAAGAPGSQVVPTAGGDRAGAS